MGRELKRKQAKKEGKNIKEINKANNLSEEEVSLKKLIIITGVIIAIAVILYWVIGTFVTKEIGKPQNNNVITESPKTATNSILASAIFRQSEEEYYVYFYDFSNRISEVENQITNKLSDKKVYRVDTSNGLNQNYVSDTTNPNAKTLEELKVKEPTIIKIVNDEITNYYEGEDSIKNIS